MAQQGGNSSGQLGSMAVASLPDTDTVPGVTPFPALARLPGLRPFWNAESPAGNRWAQGLESESCGPMGPPRHWDTTSGPDSSLCWLQRPGRGVEVVYRHTPGLPHVWPGCILSQVCVPAGINTFLLFFVALVTLSVALCHGSCKK